jgi:putative spermidine/putrescine transport system ATP-binding protein
MAYLDIRAIAKRYGTVTALAGITFQAEQGEIVALLGPSGCGKTTLLNLIAGFFAPDAGEIWVNGRDLSGVPPHRRDMAMVFQNYALFPHLTVTRNVGFGLDAKGVSRQKREPRIGQALASVRLPGFGDRYPSALSGGQQQRVALARALVLRPSLILMDEPLSNLDTLLRKEMREELRQILKSAGITAVLVTHDQEEALAVADRILLMNGGRIEQAGAPAEIYEHPRTLFGARFMETTNFVEARVTGRNGDALLLDTPIGSLRSTVGDADAGARVTVSVRPERIRIVAPGTAADDTGASQNRVSGQVRQATYLGTLNRLHVAVGEHMLIAHVPIAAEVSVGNTVVLAWNASETLVLAGAPAPETVAD